MLLRLHDSPIYSAAMCYAEGCIKAKKGVKQTAQSVILISAGAIQGKLSRRTDQSELYARCLNEFGAVGVLDGGFGSADELAERTDGLILSGGSDIYPGFYGQTMSGQERGVDVQRDEREFELLRRFCAAGKPVFGICRGIQVIDVFFGGTLFRDIGNAHLHEDTRHVVITAECGGLRPLLGRELPVNSYHHQAVRTLGKGLLVTAVSQADGVIEGLEHDSLPITAVQWHPERMLEGVCRDTDVSMRPLWERFIEQAKNERVFAAV